jgi:hypothetical protein
MIVNWSIVLKKIKITREKTFFAKKEKTIHVEWWNSMIKKGLSQTENKKKAWVKQS